MALELKQQQKLSQSLVMTPQLQMAIKILQLGRLELVDMLHEELETNPILDDTMELESPEMPRDEDRRDDGEVEWENYLEESNYRSSGIDFSESGEDNFIERDNTTGIGSLEDHIVWQLNLSGLSEEEIKVGECIVGNLDDSGFLKIVEEGDMEREAYEEATVAEVASQTSSSGETVLKVLDTIQHFDPIGVASRNIRECLLVQARFMEVRDFVVEAIIESHLGNLANKNYKAIAKKLSITVDEVFEAVRVIHSNLNPIPGSGYGGGLERTIIPDIAIYKVGDEYVIGMNDDGMPKLKISSYYRNLVSSSGEISKDAKGYIQDKLRSAMWLIKSVNQRQRTIYRVVETIIKFQRSFLDNGLKYLKPMVLKDVAEEIGVHESTVSRVTSNKYVQTPIGIFELKYFFSTGMSKSDGSDISVEYIKDQLKSLIESEDSRAPLSDQQIVETLKESGIVLARRTASKYRESLGILSSSKRKEHFIR